MKKLLSDLIKGEISAHHIDVVNTSHLHAGHENYGENSHFEITVVSDEFENLSRIERHRLILKILEVKNIHSISLKLYTKDEHESQ